MNRLWLYHSQPAPKADTCFRRYCCWAGGSWRFSRWWWSLCKPDHLFPSLELRRVTVTSLSAWTFVSQATGRSHVFDNWVSQEWRADPYHCFAAWHRCEKHEADQTASLPYQPLETWNYLLKHGLPSPVLVHGVHPVKLKQSLTVCHVLSQIFTK